ncbi:FAD binding domain-containing protein [Microbacteriaceae bacterium K1510]|nr:FAD binding domain-containing protein [Microbacteriaceae bacterium K1510]
MKPVAFDYHKASNVSDALAALGVPDGDAKPVAGGCSLGPMLNLRLVRPAKLIDLRAASDLRQLTLAPDRLTIGACWTHAEIEDGIVPDVTRGLMQKVAGGIAYRPVRNRGTIGGSLAHADPAADWVTTMAVLDAGIHISGKNGTRRESALSFMLGAYATTLAADELVTAIDVPVLSERARWAYHKIARKTGEFALAIGAVVHDPARDYARIVCGAVEAPPLVLPRASAALREGPAAALAAAEAEVDTLLLAHDGVFKQQHKVAIERALAELGR